MNKKELEEMKDNGVVELLGGLSFSADEENKLHAEPLIAEKIDEMTPEEFAKAFLMDRVLNKNVQNLLGPAPEEKKSRNTGMAR